MARAGRGCSRSGRLVRRPAGPVRAGRAGEEILASKQKVIDSKAQVGWLASWLLSACKSLSGLEFSTSSALFLAAQELECAKLECSASVSMAWRQN